jgi:hypothetical protein
MTGQMKNATRLINLLLIFLPLVLLFLLAGTIGLIIFGVRSLDTFLFND